MKLMLISRRTILAGMTVMTVAPGAWAHDPNLASFTVRVVPEGWVLDMRTSQAGLHAALRRKYGDLSQFSQAEYRAKLAEYLRENIRLSFDGERVKLSDVGLLLGDHESRARIPLPAPKIPPTRIRAELRAFSEVGSQHNLFLIDLPDARGRVMTNAKNHFVAEWRREDPPGAEARPNIRPATTNHETPHERPSGRPSPRTSTPRIVSAAALSALGLAFLFGKKRAPRN